MAVAIAASCSPSYVRSPVVRAAQSVPLSCQCEWLRVLLKGCHANPLNVDGQVGIVALHVLGQPLTAAAHSFPAAAQPSQQPSPSLAAPFAQSELDASTLQYLSHLQQLKAAAIEAEDFDSAKVLATAQQHNQCERTQHRSSCCALTAVSARCVDWCQAMKARIDRLLGVVPRIVECERRKRDAIAREEYDEAKQCKLEADRLREAALRDRDAQGGADESKEERSELPSARSRRRESRHVVDMPEVEASQQPRGVSGRQSVTVAALPDDDRPIRPAKQSSGADGHTTDTTSAAVDERPIHARQARGKQSTSKQPASSDEDRSGDVWLSRAAHRVNCIMARAHAGSAVSCVVCLPVAALQLSCQPRRC